MAQLHRRVRRVPHLRVAALAALLLVAPVAARAQDAVQGVQAGAAQGVQDETATSVAELDALAARLGSADEATRALAMASYGALDESALPAIGQRLARLRGHRPSDSRVVVALAQIRRAAGGTDSMADRTDLAAGVAAGLAASRDTGMIAAAEGVLLLRALERIGSPDAVALVPEVVALDGWVWDPETRCLGDRLGAKLLATLLVARASHSSPHVRRWARRYVTAQNGDDPGRSVQGKEPVWLAALLRAYGTVRDMHAMRVIVSYVGSEHALVREAARTALARYGRNAIWTLRDAYSLAKGEDPNPQWGSERTMRALFAVYDDRRLAEVHEDLDAGLAAYRAGDLEAMERRYDAVLARAPLLPQRAQLTDGYAALGARRLAAGDLDGAERALSRALAVAADDGARRPLRAQLALVDAERSLAAGVVDEVAYGRVLALAPDEPSARARLELVRGERASKKAMRKRLAAGLASLVLLSLGAWLWTRKRTEAKEPDAEASGSLVSPG